MIHVAVITGSYGFLGLACILGFLNLTLYIFRTQKTANSITTNITELTYISEMTMTIGVFMLTIGTFLEEYGPMNHGVVIGVGPQRDVGFGFRIGLCHYSASSIYTWFKK